MGVKKQQGQDAFWLKKMRTGKNYFDQGKPDKAAKSFGSATRLCPQRTEGWVNLGSALLEAGHHEKARQALKRALSLQPTLMLPHMILGDALRLLGRWPEAIASYSTAVSLERTPLSLNKLACALRVERRQEEAEKLLLEAIALAPQFTLARINLATLAIERGQFEEARKQLTALAERSLPPREQRELQSVQLAVGEYFRLDAAIATLNERGDLAPLETSLRTTPSHLLQADDNTVGAFGHYTATAKRVTPPSPLIKETQLQEWPLLEALFMIPHVHTVNEYVALKKRLAQGVTAEGELLESLNMQAAIEAARKSRSELQDPVKAELHLRHWHALACKGLSGFMPGHFKYSQNWSKKAPLLQRVDPALASGTLQRFISDFYLEVPAGIPRAALVCMAVCDLHAFADGNGRIGITWMNRELEWAGLAPALFSEPLGIKGKLGDARRQVRKNPGDFGPLIAVITEAQQFGREFVRQLADQQ